MSLDCVLTFTLETSVCQRVNPQPLEAAEVFVEGPHQGRGRAEHDPEREEERKQKLHLDLEKMKMTSLLKPHSNGLRKMQ